MTSKTIEQMVLILIFTFFWAVIGHFTGTTFQIALVGASIFALVNRLCNKE